MRKARGHQEISYSVKEFMLEKRRSQAPNKSLTGYDKDLMEYLGDHYMFIMSLSLKEQIDVLMDRFEWLLHEPTMFLVDRILY